MPFLFSFSFHSRLRELLDMFKIIKKSLNHQKLSASFKFVLHFCALSFIFRPSPSEWKHSEHRSSENERTRDIFINKSAVVKNISINLFSFTLLHLLLSAILTGYSAIFLSCCRMGSFQSSLLPLVAFNIRHQMRSQTAVNSRNSSFDGSENFGQFIISALSFIRHFWRQSVVKSSEWNSLRFSCFNALISSQ